MKPGFLIFPFQLVLFIFSCTQIGSNNTKIYSSKEINFPDKKIVELISPLKGGVYIHGSVLYFKAVLVSRGHTCDSLLFMVDGKRIGCVNS
jgi:hypothetical protein